MLYLCQAVIEKKEKFLIENTEIVQGSERKRILESGGCSKGGVYCDL